KMSPPLRAKEDQDAVIAGLQDGTIDALATDHAPHTNQEKLRAFTEAPNGILGFETAVGILFTKLVHTHILSLNDTIAKLSIEPARILGIEGGTLSIGKMADITVIDPNQEWIVDANQFKSKSRNTPFHGWTLKGRAILTMLGGRITHQI
ncbi:MAG: amidohydrolase family protein, partial [Candidatus Latescibacterota bacterium]